MKKVLALLLAAAMCAAALTGCGGGDKPKETEKPDNGILGWQRSRIGVCPCWKPHHCCHDGWFDVHLLV